MATFTGNISNGSSSISSVSSIVGLIVGMTLTGTGLRAGTKITSVSAGTLSISQSAIETATGVTITPSQHDEFAGSDVTFTVSGNDSDSVLTDSCSAASDGNASPTLVSIQSGLISSIFSEDSIIVVGCSSGPLTSSLGNSQLAGNDTVSTVSINNAGVLINSSIAGGGIVLGLDLVNYGTLLSSQFARDDKALIPHLENHGTLLSSRFAVEDKALIPQLGNRGVLLSSHFAVEEEMLIPRLGNRGLLISSHFAVESSELITDLTSFAFAINCHFIVDDISCEFGLTNHGELINSHFANSYQDIILHLVVDLTALNNDGVPVFQDAIVDILNLWGVLRWKSAPKAVVERAINDFNISLQEVWNVGRENYWARGTITVTIPAGTDQEELPENVQSVIGPCRLSGSRRPLVLVRTISELESFSEMFLDGDSAEEPVAYFVDRKKQSEEDPIHCLLKVSPSAGASSVALLVEVTTEAPRFGYHDMEEGTEIPMPHGYVESLLMPVARHHASNYHLFDRVDMKDGIEKAYMTALSAFGIADPINQGGVALRA